jgi:thiamine biosynthesis protein ThiS
MRITANGTLREVAAGTTVAGLIRDIGLDPSFVIVERNGEPVERRLFSEVPLVEGDRLELVRAVAGG